MPDAGLASPLINVYVNGPGSGTLIAVYRYVQPQRTLTVSSSHDSPVPGNGPNTYNDGSSVTCSVTSPVTEGSSVWTCTGWSGTGSVPVSGTDKTVTFTITQDSAITWNWQSVQRRLTVSSAHDTPSPPNGDNYLGDGSSVTCSVSSPVSEVGTIWTCTGWSGTGSVPPSGSGNSVAFMITQDSTITWNWQILDFQISTPTYVNNLEGEFPSFPDMIEASIPTGVYADDTISIQIMPSSMVRSVELETGGSTYPDTFTMEKINDDTFSVRIRVANPNDWIGVASAFIPGLPMFSDFAIPEINWVQPKITTIIVTDINGIVHTKTFDILLPTARDMWPQLFSPTNGIYFACPADILVTDLLGRREGAIYQNGTFIGLADEIPGACYVGSQVRPDGPKMIILPYSIDTYTIQVLGTAKGQFNMTLCTDIDVNYNGTLVSHTGSIDQGQLVNCSLTVGSNGDVYATAIVYQKSVVGSGYCLPVNITIMNMENSSRPFNTTLYSDATVIGTATSTVLNETSQTLIFNWNTSNLAYGNYSLSAYTVPNEEGSSGSNCIGGNIVLTIPGDINGNFVVDILDAILLSNAYLATPDRSNWNPNADINGDYIVNILDAIILSNHYNTHYP